MKIEKKTIALCLIALVTGIALVLPIAYDRGAITTVQTKPLFNINVLYANATDNTVSAIINVTTTSEVAKLKDRDVRMEIYNFHFYSDQASIANLTYTMDIPALTKNTVNGQNVITVGSHLPGSIAITDESGTLIDYSTIVSHAAGIGGYTFQRDEKSHIMGIGAYISGGGGNITIYGTTITITGSGFSDVETPESLQYTATFRVPDSAELDYLRNAQTLYVEVTRIMSVSYQRSVSNASNTSSNTSSNTTSATTVLTNNEVVANIELTKVDSGFVYGNYEQIVEATGSDIIIDYNSRPLVSFYYNIPIDYNIGEGTPVDTSEDE
jgi:hypothetical protein